MKRRLMLVFALAAMAAGELHAGPIPGLYTTGVDNANVVLAGGSSDPHYVVQETNTSAAVIQSGVIPATWLPNDTTSKWIWQDSFGNPTFVTRTFRTTFDLTGLDPNTASVGGTWTTDNFGDEIFINGLTTGNTSGGFSFYTPFAITSGFQSGINTLDFVVRDVGVIAGFRVGSIAGDASPIPEPTGLVLAVMALFSASLFIRRKNGRDNMPSNRDSQAAGKPVHDPRFSDCDAVSSSASASAP